MGKHRVGFSKLTDMFVGDSKKGAEALRDFENVMVDIFENSDNIDTLSMKIDSNEVVIDEGTLFYCKPLKVEILAGISVGGLLCSEWFGALESEQEGRFCTFLYSSLEKIKVNPANSIILYFDSNNTLMKFLVKNDYFEYEKRKKNLKQKLFDSLDEKEKEKFYEEAEKAYREEMS